MMLQLPMQIVSVFSFTGALQLFALRYHSKEKGWSFDKGTCTYGAFD